MRTLARTLLMLAGLVASAVAIDRLYRSHLRTWLLTWGATPAEAADTLPGDELLESPDIVATRAIEIDAPPSAIWPWLVQMARAAPVPTRMTGSRTCSASNMHGADRIVPEWQDLSVGDVLRSRKDRPGMRVEILEPERVLSNRSEAGDWVWTFALAPKNCSTRLISRNRIAMTGAAAGSSQPRV